jgi:hypothetical protein
VAAVVSSTRAGSSRDPVGRPVRRSDARRALGASSLLYASYQVVARLAGASGPELVRAEAEKGTSSKNPDAVDLAIRGWDLVLRANRLPSEDKRETFHQARDLFDRALDIDPNDPLAAAGSGGQAPAYSGVAACARATSRASSCRSLGIFRATAFGQQRALSLQASQSNLLAR